MRSNLSSVLVLGAMGGLIGATPVSRSSSERSTPEPPRIFTDRPYLCNIMGNTKQKPCGRKRIRKPRVTSPASHHHARYLKRAKKRQAKKAERVYWRRAYREMYWLS